MRAILKLVATSISDIYFSETRGDGKFSPFFLRRTKIAVRWKPRRAVESRDSPFSTIIRVAAHDFTAGDVACRYRSAIDS